VFERFLSDERQVVPDIDIDFDAARREEVIQYVYNRYGVDHAAMASTLVTFRARSALRDVGKALGLPIGVIDELASAVDRGGLEGLREHPLSASHLGRRLEDQLFALCEQIDGFPRHLGIHNGGMVITMPPITQRVPTEPATMPGRVVVQWDKDSLEEAGLIKIDILGLRMLSALAETVGHVEAQTGRPLALKGLSYDDPAIFRMITDADGVGVFQVESRAQAQILPRLKPNTFADIIVSISLIRPGRFRAIWSTLIWRVAVARPRPPMHTRCCRTRWRKPMA
jgi:error-prone DNA polymerase